MSSRYDYRDIQTAIEQLTSLTAEIEEIATEFLEAGNGITGFEGMAAEAEKRRFSEDYEALRIKSEENKETVYRMLGVGLESFLDVDIREDAVIHVDSLWEAEREIRQIFAELEEEFKGYNSAVSEILDPGIRLDRLPVQILDEELEPLLFFLYQLIQRLEEADQTAAEHLEQCLEGYEDLLSDLLLMFEPDVQVKLLGDLSEVLPPETRKKVNDALEVKSLEIRLIENKERLMKELKLESEEEFQSYLENQIVIFRLWQGMRKEIRDFEKLDRDERLRLRIEEGVNPVGDFIFMAQLEGGTLEQRLEMLREFKRNKVMSQEALERILGRKLRFMDPALAHVSFSYNASRFNMSLAEAMHEGWKQDLNTFFEFGQAVMMTSMSEYMKSGLNPDYKPFNPLISEEVEPLKIWSEEGKKGTVGEIGRVNNAPEITGARFNDGGTVKPGGSAFGEMSAEDALRYDQYWENAAKRSGLSKNDYYNAVEDSYYAERIGQGYYNGFGFSAFEGLGKPFSGTETAKLLDNMPELSGTNREKLLSVIQDEDLWKEANEFYRPGGKIGDGGTAAILRDEYINGNSRHLQKATERLDNLKDIARSGNLGLNDLDIVEALIID